MNVSTMHVQNEMVALNVPLRTNCYPSQGVNGRYLEDAVNILSVIFQRSRDSGKVLSIGKDADVTVLFKKVGSRKTGNYICC